MSDESVSQQAALTGAPMEIIDRLLKENRELRCELRDWKAKHSQCINSWVAGGVMLGLLLMSLVLVFAIPK